MKRSSARFGVLLCVFGIAACSKNSAAPASPSTAADVSAAANPDGTTLKATPPTPVSPANGQKLELTGATTIQLVVNNAESKNNVGLPASYQFQLFDANNQLIEVSDHIPAGATQTSYTIQASLEGDRTYSWRARAEVNQGQYVGSWSDQWSFIAPTSEGYIQGSELYDPLINGKTVGSVSGPHYFVPGRGIKLLEQISYVAYVLPETLTQGEFSMLVTEMPANTDGDKTKMMSMGEGFGDVVINNRRMTLEKRGDPAGVVAWRLITNADQIDTEGTAQRRYVDFRADRLYHVFTTWKNNYFNVVIREGGVDGPKIYEMGKPYRGRQYDPTPHVLYLGMPPGRSGASGASVDGMLIRQVWASSRPRPAFAK